MPDYAYLFDTKIKRCHIHTSKQKVESNIIGHVMDILIQENALLLDDPISVLKCKKKVGIKLVSFNAMQHCSFNLLDINGVK